MYESPLHVIEIALCDLSLGRVCAWQVDCISWSWCLLFFVVWRNTAFIIRVYSKTVGRSRNRKSIAMRHRPICWWYIQIHKCWFFFHGLTILNRGHHKELTVKTVVTSHPPNHGHSKLYAMSISIQPLFELVWTRSVAHVWFPFYFLINNLAAEIQEIYLFNSLINGSIPCGKCHFSANIEHRSYPGYLRTSGTFL